MFKAHALENHPKSTVLLSETDTENVDKPTKKESEILKEVDGKKLLLYFAMNFVVALKSLEAGQNLKLKCHFMLFFVISCHFMSFHVILCHFVSFHVTLCYLLLPIYFVVSNISSHDVTINMTEEMIISVILCHFMSLCHFLSLYVIV